MEDIPADLSPDQIESALAAWAEAYADARALEKRRAEAAIASAAEISEMGAKIEACNTSIAASEEAVRAVECELAAARDRVDETRGVLDGIHARKKLAESGMGFPGG